MSLKDRLRRLVDVDTRVGRVFGLVVQSLILLSLITFCLETLPDLTESQSQILRTIEVATVALFSLEYLVRVAAAARPGAYIFSFFGVIDLLAILPFYVARGFDLRAVRVVRLFRVLRTLKLVRYSRAVARFRAALVEAREELALFAFLTVMVLFLASVGIYYCEREAQPDVFTSVFDAMWWSVATLTTVGYGDIYPITPLGKLFSFVVLMVGLGVVAVPPAILASSLTTVRSAEAEDRSQGEGLALSHPPASQAPGEDGASAETR